MPTYLVTDKHGPSRVMVEAQRPATALSLLIDNRFTVSAALEAGDAIRLTRDGVPFLDGSEPGGPDFAEVDPPLEPLPPLSSFQTIEGEQELRESARQADPAFVRPAGNGEGEGGEQ